MGPLGPRRRRKLVLVSIASVVLAAVSWVVWYLVDSGVGRSLSGQIVSVAAGLVLGIAAFLAICRLLGVDELETMLRLRKARRLMRESARRRSPLITDRERPAAALESGTKPAPAVYRSIDSLDREGGREGNPTLGGGVGACPGDRLRGRRP